VHLVGFIIRKFRLTLLDCAILWVHNFRL